MTANFLCVIKNLGENSDFNGQMKIGSQDFCEVGSDRVEDVNLPKNASAFILFKNEIVGREAGGTPIIEKFNPTDIQQFVLTTEPFLNLPQLFLRFPIVRGSTEGVVGGYVLADGTLFLVNDEMKKEIKPIFVKTGADLAESHEESALSKE